MPELARAAGVTDRVLELGFLARGRFATSYSGRFGVRLSTTLRSGAGTAVR
jgi:hypothetical protein